MLQILGLLITTASIAGLGIILEGATQAQHWLRSRLSPSSPLTEGERGEDGEDPDNEEDVCN